MQQGNFSLLIDKLEKRDHEFIFQVTLDDFSF